jgi:glycogen synthase
MKILVITNLYPPHHVGGYELGCRDVVEKLRARGHAVHVLTGDFFIGDSRSPTEEAGVERILQFNVRVDGLPHHKRAECRKFAAVANRFSPDVVYFWNLAGLCLWLPLAARRRGRRMAFFLSDTTFVTWRIGAWLAGAATKNSLIRAVLGKTFLVRGWPVIQSRPCHFASEFLRNLAVKNEIFFSQKNSIVAHWGIEPSQFAAAPRGRRPVRRLLYAGQMIPQKGVHTAIAAFARLAPEKGFEDFTLSLAGGGMNPDYEKQLRALPEQLGVAGRVHFLGKISRNELRRVYAENDILVFPSEWDEPFAITPLEAITGGLAVVGTTTGGSGELFQDRETAMTFRTGDAADCARAIRELCGDPELLENIRRNAQREVLAKYTLDVMVDAVEKSLRRIVEDD